MHVNTLRNLVLVLGDQLNHDSAALEDFDEQRDRVWMAENQDESTHVWCHKTRLVAFFSPMRHFRDELRGSGKTVLYHELPIDGRKARSTSFASLLAETLAEQAFEKIILVQPGDHRVLAALETTTREADVAMEVREDRHFYCSIDRFAQWSDGRKSMVLENFYRVMREEHRVLLDSDGAPEGGQWNFDKDNRGKFGKGGPGDVPSPPTFRPDAITRDVITMVEARFNDHPGKCDQFDLPVNRKQALRYLADFIEHRLANFGKYQDAMWTGETFLYHSRLSNAINLHLLSPREVVDAAVAAYRNGTAPLAATEGFVRQILGWREYVRGVYWTRMPEYATLNSLDCDLDQDVPSSYWDGRTNMACVADAMRLLIDTAYAHHIQRLMVLGLFAQLMGVHPAKFNEWHMAMYADAVDWVSLPNALGMSQHGDGGVMATKPYCASGNYINKMSNHCKTCRYKYNEAIGDDACPVTTLYWDFLDRNRERFTKNHRMVMQIKNLERKSPSEMDEIRDRANKIRRGDISV
ncbi:Deoxyribodipyrimidine photo-lyase-related protein [Rubripirellula tenax]|uniref:Deoxyribodipyrimidine photo-lyase-related protein n=1 Tax=Rubripirellula tenax TaxID=2528015 RepID=A0A5C6FBT8_9BACT|nr:cryptochrome/photolyase family protein [Rubripirellula tenax]TWU57069.1 Deoxyribodipyrimidine photo-lyase-related protein [Rubripirellula tenax]